MSFQLRITFIGMCLFVPDVEKGRMHVLMPATGSSGGADGGHDGQDGHGEPSGGRDGGAHAGHHGVERHALRLVFDTANLSEGAKKPADLLVQVSLSNRVLVLPPIGSILNPNLPDDLVPLSSPLDPAVLGQLAQQRLSSRVELGSGYWSGHHPGECWELEEGQPRRMSHVLEWTVDEMPGRYLFVNLALLGGGLAESIGPLHPIDGILDLEVYHVPPAELPPDPELPAMLAEGEPAHHFAAFAPLLRQPTRQLPRFQRGKCPSPPPDKKPPRGGNPFRCMGARTTL